MNATARVIMSTAIIGAALAMFAPAFADASASMDYGSFKYGDQLKVIVDNMALILLVIALAVLAAPLGRLTS